MKKIGECRTDCPIIAMLDGRTDAIDGVSIHDGLMAERLSSRPHVKEELIEGCPLGGPHKQFLGFGKIACSAEYTMDWESPEVEFSELEG